MNYKDKLVGDVELAPNAPAWLVQLAGSLQNVDRDEYLKQIEDFNVSIKAQGRAQAQAKNSEGLLNCARHGKTDAVL